MTHELTNTQARNLSTSDLVIYNEIDSITRKIYSESLAGELFATINDDTTMTTSTPKITVTGSVSNPTFTPSDTLIISGVTVTLGDGGNDGTNLIQAVGDINDADITGVTASRNDSNQLVIEYEPTQNNWSLIIGSGTANASFGISDGTVTASDPASVSYYNVWNNTTEDRKISYEFAQVVNHFQNLGFNILAKKNTDTGNTFYWEVYW